jgi:hypothetical protein
MYFNYLPNTLDANRVFPTGSTSADGYVGVMSIPSKFIWRIYKTWNF